MEKSSHSNTGEDSSLRKNGKVHNPSGTVENKKIGVMTKAMSSAMKRAMDSDVNNQYLQDNNSYNRAAELAIDVYINFNGDIKKCREAITNWKLDLSTINSDGETTVIDIESNTQNGKVIVTPNQEMEARIKSIAIDIITTYIETKKIFDESANITSPSAEDRKNDDVDFITKAAYWLQSNIIQAAEDYISNKMGNSNKLNDDGGDDDSFDLDTETEQVERAKLTSWILKTYLAKKDKTTQGQVNIEKQEIHNIESSSIIDATVPIIFTVKQKIHNITINSSQTNLLSGTTDTTNTSLGSAISSFNSLTDEEYGFSSQPIGSSTFQKWLDTRDNAIKSKESVSAKNETVEITDIRTRDRRLKFYVNMETYGVLIPIHIWEEIYRIFAYYCGVRTKLIANQNRIGHVDAAQLNKADKFENASNGWFATSSNFNILDRLKLDNDSEDEEDFEEEEFDEEDEEEFDEEKQNVETKIDIALEQTSVTFADGLNKTATNDEVIASKHSVANQYNIKKRNQSLVNGNSKGSPTRHSRDRSARQSVGHDLNNRPNEYVNDNKTNSSVSSLLKSQGDPPEVKEILKVKYTSNIEKFIAQRAINFYRNYYTNRNNLNIANTLSNEGGNGISDVDNRSYVLLTMRHLFPFKALKLLKLTQSEISKLDKKTNKDNNNNATVSVSLNSTNIDNIPPVGHKSSYVIEDNIEISSSISAVLFYALKIFGILDIECIPITKETDAYKLHDCINIRNDIKLVNNEDTRKIINSPAVISLAMKAVPEMYWKKQNVYINNSQQDDYYYDEVDATEEKSNNGDKYIRTIVNDVKADYWLNMVYDEKNQSLDINNMDTKNELSVDSSFVFMKGEWHQIASLLSNAYKDINNI